MAAEAPRRPQPRPLADVAGLAAYQPPKPEPTPPPIEPRYLSRPPRNSNAAGYNYRWAKFRKRYLADNPLCLDCLARGISTPARDVHHIRKMADLPELQYELANLMPLCRPCHSRRTARGE